VKLYERVKRGGKKGPSSETSGREKEGEKEAGQFSLIRESLVCARCNFMMVVETVVGTKRYRSPIRLLAGCIRAGCIAGIIESNPVTRLVTWCYSLRLCERQ